MRRHFVVVRWPSVENSVLNRTVPVVRWPQKANVYIICLECRSLTQQVSSRAFNFGEIQNNTREASLLYIYKSSMVLFRNGAVAEL